MKLFSASQMQAWDQQTLVQQNIKTADLMERAGQQVFNWVRQKMGDMAAPAHIFCGIGNNGGDGLVLARHLIQAGYHVKIYIVNYSDKRSDGFLTQYDRIKSETNIWPSILTNDDHFPEIDTADLIVDAVFGIGLNRAVTPWLKALFNHFKESGAFTLAIDIPSGLYMDRPLDDSEAVVCAHYTLSFECPKLVFFLPDTALYTFDWELLDIGLDPDFPEATNATANLVTPYDALMLYRPREKFSHKGTFGHALIIGGSYGKLGAVTLASRATLSIGAGLVTAFIPSKGYTVLQSSFPEAMVITDPDPEKLTTIGFQITPTSIGFGVGAGSASETKQAFKQFLKINKTPLVIDADGINILSEHKNLLELLPQNTILTPHVKELERLIGPWDHDFEKIRRAQALSKTYNIILVLKGAHTVTLFHDTFYVNSTGNPGLATAGSGDVLTGIITGLLAQGYLPLDAAIFGVYMHGLAADLAIQQRGYESLIASDVIEYLGSAYRSLLEHFQKDKETD